MPADRLSRQLYELLSSMRFAVSLLTVIAIASIIGTVLLQGEPYPNYAAQFGPFWFALFQALGLYDVYHAAWFLVILAFLVLSTSVCVYRNAPGMLREMRSFREHAEEKSLSRFAHRAEFALAAPEADQRRLESYLAAAGFRFRVRGGNDAAGQPHTLIAARAGAASRWGYILAHVAIVIICLGGLLDGNVPLKLQQALGMKRIETRDIPQSQVPAESRLGSGNLSFRANVTVPEGALVDVAFQNVADGYLVQELPFTIRLKRFHIEHYSTGQPKAFASDLVVTDKATGRVTEATIEVNKPLLIDGIAIYQASFGDGGTLLRLRRWPLSGPSATPGELAGQVQKAAPIALGNAEYRIEFTDFRPFNVENFSTGAEPVRAPLSSAPSRKDLRNVGPSFQFKLRDAQGQAREYTTFMLPISIEGTNYFISGMRATPGEPFRYIRIPADRDGAIDTFMRLRAALADPALRSQAAARFAETAASGPAVGETLRAKLEESTERMLQMFAAGGYQAVVQFIETAVPLAERPRATETYLRILDGVALHLLRLAQAKAGLPALPDAAAASFVRESLLAASDALPYGSPIFLQLASYDEVKASGLQLTRAPGMSIVYAGSLLLVAGIFAMLYIRERRLFLLVKPAAGRVLLAMSANRKSLDFEREFTQHRQRIGELLRDGGELPALRDAGSPPRAGLAAEARPEL